MQIFPKQSVNGAAQNMVLGQHLGGGRGSLGRARRGKALKSGDRRVDCDQETLEEHRKSPTSECPLNLAIPVQHLPPLGPDSVTQSTSLHSTAPRSTKI